ncbi:Glutaredoxin-C1 [Vitis vinifera]|uniref:Glutaredoxin-C1 n=1 Tax=Vitis vinifera TaxID=29760 RepID=A0A438KBT4_VITVI|nr:Glutaredoxin-C1 [Vitis vinifera]
MRPSQSRTSQHLGAGLGKITLDRVVSRSPEDSPFSRRSTLVGTPAGSLSLPPSKTSRVAFQHLSRSVLSLYQYPIAMYNQGTEEFWKWVPFSARERARRKWKWPSQRPKRSFLQHLLLSSGDIPLKSGSLFPMVKTYCGYCKRVKQLLSQLKATHKTIELDQESDGAEIQSALREWTGQSTVPNVFIGGKHMGGCDSVMEKHQEGKLVPLLKEAGAIAEVSTQL